MLFFFNILSMIDCLYKEKKCCAFDVGILVLSQKNSKSFGGKNLCRFKPDFALQKSRYFFDFVLDGRLKSAGIFFFWATSPRQKKLKEIAYKMASYQAPFKSPGFFFIYCK